jgi:hypothetical protein
MRNKLIKKSRTKTGENGYYNAIYGHVRENGFTLAQSESFINPFVFSDLS